MENILNNKTKKLVIAGMSILLIFLVVVAIFTLSEKREPEQNVKGEATLQPLTFKHKSTIETVNSNFEIPSEISNVKAATTDNNETNALDNEIQNSNSTNTVVVESMGVNTLVIPRLNVRTSVIEGVDGEKAIHEGAWLYPNSYEGEGEKIFLGHRRFWGADDPRSFWNLDQLQAGDTIHYSDAKGIVYNYEVKSVVVRNAGDLSTLKPSKENIIKVISCSTADGTAGSSEKRIVVIATQI
jgi:LPXTG-site transpeptidase (sortase) family protein